jgi:hypothetical protein
MARKLVLAVALLDIAVHCVKAGEIIEATEEQATALAATGQVDRHKAAVAAAREAGAQVKRSALLVQQAEKDKARAETLQAELQALQVQHDKEPEDTRPELAARLKRLQAELLTLQQQA